ncbi:hypothetical protein [Aeromicrobium sp. Leaf350]|uniref:hypothetical protein n=1 Tax=Aeromicrobium sp. Leaf350 TaxID=2876565 RepID=UPI001E3FEB0A|nr:hypothetical protein [Aeromicrobium sp. Leaf350]
METQSHSYSWVAAVLASALVVTLLGGGDASAETESPSPAAEAVESVGAEPAAVNDLAVLPSSSDATAIVGVPGAVLEISVEAGQRVEGTAGSVSQTFEGTGPDTLVTVESTEAGLRVLNQIDSVESPMEFEVNVGGDVASLEVQLDGSVAVLAADGRVLGVSEAPWAVDADGIDVPTRYEVRGTTLVQVVEHRADGVAYPVVADPDFIYLARCGAAIGIFVASNGNLVGKIAKVIGNAAKFYKVLKQYKSKANAVRAIAYELSGAKGVDEVVSTCWP